MLGLMQQHPLLLSSIITHAARHHAEAEVVSKLPDGSLHRTTYAVVERRSRCLARVLQGLGVRMGDRVATLAWNGYRHLELYYAISGMGAVCHTVNPASRTASARSSTPTWPGGARRRSRPTGAGCR